MTKHERKRANGSLVFLNKNRDQTIKSRISANRSSQQAYIFCKEVTILTAASETTIATGVIDATKKRDVMMLDIPNEFVQTEILLDGDKIIMKIRGQ